MRLILGLSFLVACAAAQQVFFGRFISTPAQDVLSIEMGAVLVNSSEGHGVIEKAVWNVTDVESALEQLGAGNNATVISAADDGFFFPGFIGEFFLALITGHSRN